MLHDPFLKSRKDNATETPHCPPRLLYVFFPESIPPEKIMLENVLLNVSSSPASIPVSVEGISRPATFRNLNRFFKDHRSDKFSYGILITAKNVDSYVSRPGC